MGSDWVNLRPGASDSESPFGGLLGMATPLLSLRSKIEPENENDLLPPLASQNEMRVKGLSAKADAMESLNIFLLPKSSLNICFACCDGRIPDSNPR
jgi:hypothetical protein